MGTKKQMSEKATKIPQIRFDGYTDAWEQRELGEIAARVQGNDGRMDLPTLTISAANGWMNQKERFSGNIAGKEQKNYTLLHKGELSYNHGNSKLAKYGAVFSLETYKEALVPRVYHSFKVIDGNPKFIEYYFATKIPDRELAKLVSSGARMDGLLNINFNEFMGINLTVPNKSEQEKISNYFSNLDHLITLHQRECDLLAKMKKSYLQKMFPKNGEDKPEIRFAGFTDAWEQRKLKELGDIQTGNTPSTSNADNYSIDGMLWVTPTDIKSLVISDTSKKLSEAGVLKARIAKAGSILVTSIASIGKNTLVTKDVGFNQQINALTPTNNNDSYFLLTQSEKWSAKMKQTAAAATMQIVNKTDFSNISTLVPVRKDEQKKIGTFFKQLDDLIALHQRELDSLKKMKKSLLQMMFV